MQTIMPCQSGLQGRLQIPGDKSISHRGVMIGAIAHGETVIKNFLLAEDCLSTIAAFRSLGIEITQRDDVVVIQGKGLYGLTECDDVINVNNSGTTMRLLSGILAAAPFRSIITGDDSLRKRPMARIITPLKQMGGQIYGFAKDHHAPLMIFGTSLRPVRYDSQVASAQVKSAVLLAGLYCQGETVFSEPTLSRNHTELMLQAFGAKLWQIDGQVHLSGPAKLQGQRIHVPGDISTAAFLIVAGLILPNSHIVLEHVGINPTRTGILDILQEMGGQITLLNKHQHHGEEVADIQVLSSTLHAVDVAGDIIPRLIDEIPILAVAAAFAHGQTRIGDAQELMIKESNRLATITEGLGRMGADIKTTADGLLITGGKPLQSARCASYGDHRIALALAIAGLASTGRIEIEDFSAIDVSWPSFLTDIAKLMKE